MSTTISFERPADAPDLGPHIYSCAARGLPMVEKDTYKGKKALIVSTGPSIMDPKIQAKVKKLAKRRVVFALKESIPLMRRLGVKVTFSVSMDPGGDRQVARTPTDPEVTYCVASSCSPKLFDHLLEAGCTVNVFHSACGHSEPVFEPGLLHPLWDDDHGYLEGIHEIQNTAGDSFCPVVNFVRGEVDIYQDLFPNADVMCGGYTVTNRALALAKYMGFSGIIMAGTDFGWRTKGGSHYGDLVQVPSLDDNFMTDGGEVDGTPWYTRPDQLASAVDIAKKARAGEVKVLGDSLAAALAKRDDAFLNSVVQVK